MRKIFTAPKRRHDKADDAIKGNDETIKMNKSIYSLDKRSDVLLDVVGVEVTAQARAVLCQHAVTLTSLTGVARYLLK